MDENKAQIIYNLTPIFEKEEINEGELDLVAGGGIGSRLLASGLLSLALFGTASGDTYAANSKAVSVNEASSSSSKPILFKTTQSKVDFSNQEESRRFEIFSEDIYDGIGKKHKLDPEFKIKVLEKAYEVSKDFWEYLNSKGITDFEIKDLHSINPADSMFRGKLVFKSKKKGEPTDRYFEKSLKPYIEKAKKAEDKQKALEKADEALGYAKNDFIQLTELFPYHYMFYCKEKNVIPFIPGRFIMITPFYSAGRSHYRIENYDPPDELKDEYERIKKELFDNVPKNILLCGSPKRVRRLNKLEKYLKESSAKVSDEIEKSAFPMTIDGRAEYKFKDWETVSKFPDIRENTTIYSSARQAWEKHFENNKKEFDKIFDILQRAYAEYKGFAKYLKQHKTLEKEVYKSEKFEKQNSYFSEATKHRLLDERTVVQKFIDEVKTLPEKEKYTIENFRKARYFCTDLYSKTYRVVSSYAKRCCPLEYARFCKETNTTPDPHVSRVDLFESTTTSKWGFKERGAIYQSYTTEELQELVDFSFYQLSLFANHYKDIDLRSYGEKYLRDKDPSTNLNLADKVANLRKEFLKRKSTLSKDELADIYYNNMKLSIPMI